MSSDSIIFVVVTVWFVLSILAFFASHLWLLAQVYYAGVNFNFSSIGLPGYLDHIYSEYCAKQGKSCAWFLRFRVILVVSVMLSAFFFIPVVSGT